MNPAISFALCAVFAAIGAMNFARAKTAATPQAKKLAMSAGTLLMLAALGFLVAGALAFGNGD